MNTSKMRTPVKKSLCFLFIMGFILLTFTSCSLQREATCPMKKSSKCISSKAKCPRTKCPKTVSSKIDSKLNYCKTIKMQGKVITNEKKDVKLHTYISPPKGGLVTSHIIESKNKLVIVDAQFLVPFAKEVRAYADSLGKPIDRIIITHGHPDHFAGLGAAFEDIPVYTTFKTKKFIEMAGAKVLKNKRKKMGDLITEKVIIPSNIIESGKEIIDGVPYEFKIVSDGEAADQLVVKLPKQKTLISQDLTYNNVHLFLGNNTFKEWITILEELQMLPEYEYILAGHGEPADRSIFNDNIAYLKTASDIFARVDNGKDLKAELIKKYPNRGGIFLLDISNKFLYK